eukprot:CAMPEP_0119303824 /NCGR_PEP_ID=MMETSP1333-20130426/5205_1 /TAXON_ID=418940 /ORGANISM="Scyphosphaera apsteinii, Strain RCC1455" /LENGTH=81 /DNA_ID=CAMNT_0007306595 /DNA_START=98 /DNA_END=339 /DNA_ORIENTATION=+
MTHTSKALFWFTYFHGAFDNIVALNFGAQNVTGVTATTYRFFGAAALGDSVYFAPSKADVVGVLNTTTSTFSTVALTGVTA